MMFLRTASRRKVVGGLVLLACIVTTLEFLEHKREHSLTEEHHNPEHQKVLFPAGFKISKRVLGQHMQSTLGKDWDLLQLKMSEIMAQPPQATGVFTPGECMLYDQSTGSDCARKGKQVRFEADESQQVPYDLSKIFKILNEEADVYGDSYSRYIRPIFSGFMTGNVDDYWYRFSGSSVWLKDYNVHFVVSRLLFTENTSRVYTGLVSFTLAQIFDKDWNEVEDVRMVVPSNEVENSPGFTINGQKFIVHRFPRILPIPFDLKPEMWYQGAEDPRILLVKNKNGHEEPLVIFNSAHNPPIPGSKGPDGRTFRCMSISFPFQLQKGKRLRAPEPDGTENDWFTRTKYITIKGEKERDIEKNWTPFVSGRGDFHEHAMFAPQLDPLIIVKCELWTDNSECEYDTTNNIKNVRELRGGTPLHSLKTFEKEDREVFVGLARTHLDDCGCGYPFYRPNLILVVRDGQDWSLTHVSSAMDFGLNTLPRRPGDGLCHTASVVLPFGIEHFNHETDVMSVFITVADTSVERLHVRGVMKFLESAGYGESLKSDAAESPVPCAMIKSVEFCSAYVKQHVDETFR